MVYRLFVEKKPAFRQEQPIRYKIEHILCGKKQNVKGKNVIL